MRLQWDMQVKTHSAGALSPVYVLLAQMLSKLCSILVARGTAEEARSLESIHIALLRGTTRAKRQGAAREGCILHIVSRRRDCWPPMSRHEVLIDETGW